MGKGWIFLIVIILIGAWLGDTYPSTNLIGRGLDKLG